MAEQIDRYELASEIGHGGMATVYRARDTRLDRWVAVKLMHPHLRGTVEARARFSREARAVAKLKHPSILEIYDYSGSDSDNAYIATELLTGPTLRAFVERVGEVPPEVAVCVGVALASALSAAHAQGIVHRDVKPENVLLHESQVLKLTDFGIADMLDPTVSAMTATGQILGSPAHMAPEQVEGGDSDARTDVFALGTILYWLALGSLPFTGKNPHQVLKRVVEAQPIDPLIARPSIGRPLRDVILRCLEKAPEARYQSANALEQALLGLLLDVGIPDPAGTLSDYLRDPAGQSARIHAHVFAHLLEHARTALQRGDRARVMECLDRVLSADEHNPEALALLSRVDRATRARAIGRAAFAVLAAAACVTLWFLFAPEPSPATSIAGVAERPLGGGSSSAQGSAGASAGTLGLSTSDAAVADAGSAQVASAAVVPGQSPGQAAKTAARTAKPKALAVAVVSKPRTVQFSPEPVNVSISVDGTPARPFGPTFRSVELEPGPHTFLFVGARNCCEDQMLSIDVPNGPGETSIAPKLAFKHARVYVASNVPADVRIDGVDVGRARSLLSVSRLRGLAERRQISVTAPGFATYTGMVELRAGEVTELDVDLEPSAQR